MKKTLSSITALFSVIFCINAACAPANPAAPFSTGPAPTQSYHTLASNTLVTQVTPTQGQKQAATKAAQNDASYLNSAGVDTTEQGALTRMTQDNLAFEQQAGARIQNLVESNQAIAVAIQNINAQIATLQHQVKIMETVDSSAQTTGDNTGFQWMNTLSHDDVLVYINMLLAAVFLTGFGLMMGRRMQARASGARSTQTRKANPVDEQDDIKSEYDFMATQEALPAQLDLARSYIAMGDYAQAKDILKIILNRGDREQSFEARLMMERIENK